MKTTTTTKTPTTTATATATVTPTEPRARPERPASHRSPAAAAAVTRNAMGGDRIRRRRWLPVRDALWALLDDHLPVGAHVAIVGAGNGDTVPLRRLARRAARLDLIDLDAAALRRARRRIRFARHARAVIQDVTAGEADAIINHARGRPAAVARPSSAPIGHGPYDVVIADLLSTQLLFPALSDSGLSGPEIDRVLIDHGQALTNCVVARLHGAAPDGLVVHVHDILAWTAGHRQPVPLAAILALAETDPAAALTLAQRGNVPYGCDPRIASSRAGATLTPSTFWTWPFAPGTDYLVSATLAHSARPKDLPTRAQIATEERRSAPAVAWS